MRLILNKNTWSAADRTKTKQVLSLAALESSKENSVDPIKLPKLLHAATKEIPHLWSTNRRGFSTKQGVAGHHFSYVSTTYERKTSRIVQNLVYELLQNVKF